jgi:hypothetical protein
MVMRWAVRVARMLRNDKYMKTLAGKLKRREHLKLRRSKSVRSNPETAAFQGNCTLTAAVWTTPPHYPPRRASRIHFLLQFNIIGHLMVQYATERQRMGCCLYASSYGHAVWNCRSYKRRAFLDEVCNYQLVKTDSGFGSPCRRRESVFTKRPISLTNSNQYRTQRCIAISNKVMNWN